MSFDFLNSGNAQTGSRTTEHSRPSQEMPGPYGHWLWGNVPTFRRDPLGPLIRGVQTYGDVVRFRFGLFDGYLFNRAEPIKHILQDNSQNYVKSRGYRKMKSFLGNGLITNDGESWQRQRRLMQPAFHRKRLNLLAPIIINTGEQMIQSWQARARQAEPVNVHAEMLRATMSIATASLFSYDVSSAEADAVAQALAIFQEYTLHNIQALIEAPVVIPTRRNRRFKRALREIDSLVYSIIKQRREGTVHKGDLLDTLLDSVNGNSDEGMTDRQLRDEMVTLLFAGHETSGNVLTWTLYLLCKQPEAEERLRSEIETSLGSRRALPEDLRRLPFMGSVIKESMRLYPPIWVIEREALDEDVVAGYRIPPRSWVIISPYTIHRHPDYWKNPEQFDPEHFSAPAEAARPHYAFLPFGGGPRLCIGSNLAWMEVNMLLAMILQEFQLFLVSEPSIEALPQITLRPKTAMRMNLRAIH